MPCCIIGPICVLLSSIIVPNATIRLLTPLAGPLDELSETSQSVTWESNGVLTHIYWSAQLSFLSQTRMIECLLVDDFGLEKGTLSSRAAF